MATQRKIVLHSHRGYRSELDPLVQAWIAEGVKYVGVVGVGAAEIEDRIDNICAGDGTTKGYFMVTAAHSQDETLEDAIFLAEIMSSDSPSVVCVIEF